MTQKTNESKSRDAYQTDEKDLKTGRNLPDGDGTVADEQVHAIAAGGVNAKKGKTGQDHSLENYEESEPDEGVGSFQNHSDTGSDIAHIKE
jgi:hypothetical protein